MSEVSIESVGCAEGEKCMTSLYYLKGGLFGAFFALYVCGLALWFGAL
jgi:hypothetical protein